MIQHKIDTQCKYLPHDEFSKTSMVELFAKIIPLIFLHNSSVIEFSQGYKHAKAKQKEVKKYHPRNGPLSCLNQCCHYFVNFSKRKS